MPEAPWKCCGCGKEAVGVIKPCDCPTMCGYRDGGGATWLVMPCTFSTDKATRFPHARLALGRLFTLLAIITLPRDRLPALELLFEADDDIREARAALQMERRK